MATPFDTLLDVGTIDIDGNVVNRLRDILHDKKCILVVNVASHSPFADMNFEGLNELYEKYEKHGFEILAFPCNQFGKEKELMGDHDFKDYIMDKYGCQFPLFHKTKVNGKETDDVF